MMRQIAGAFAEYEKARHVHKQRHARERQRRERGKCEGRKAHVELRPGVVAEAKGLRRASPKTGERFSYRKISEKLAAAVGPGILHLGANRSTDHSKFTLADAQLLAGWIEEGMRSFVLGKSDWNERLSQPEQETPPLITGGSQSASSDGLRSASMQIIPKE